LTVKSEGKKNVFLECELCAVFILLFYAESIFIISYLIHMSLTVLIQSPT